MEKNYIEIDTVGRNLSYVVNELLSYDEKGILACTDFNGHMLYSDSIDIDKAYLEIHGVTKEEFDKTPKKSDEKYLREEKEYQSKIPELTKIYIEKGHSILDKKYWKKWDKEVQISMNSVYKGNDLKICLDVISALNNNCSFLEAKYLIDKEHCSETYLLLVESLIENFCDSGVSFCEYLKNNEFYS